MYRLVSEPAEAGLCCRNNGLTLAGVRLLDAHGAGFEPRPLSELQRILDAAYGSDSGIDAVTYLPGLRTVARALDDRDLSRAMIASLLLKLPEINTDGAARLSGIEALLKFNYNPLEPRNWHGRWTDGGSGFEPVQVPIPGTGFFPPPGLSGGSNPKRPDDDFTFPPQIGASQPGGINTQTSSNTAANDNEPQACPDPSYEPSSVGRTREQLLYQAQITGNRLGWHVVLNEIGYDGCRESDQHMLEAKMVNGWFLLVPEKYRTRLDDYNNIMNQARDQSTHSGGRQVEWHFSNKAVAEYYDREFLKANLLNVRAVYTKYDENYNYNLIRDDISTDFQFSTLDSVGCRP